MLFNSYEFIFAFLPITFFGYYLTSKFFSREFAFIWLIFASLFFYGWWNPAYLILIISSMLFNYTVGNKITSRKKRGNPTQAKYLLIFGITINLLLLGYFKYANFFVENVNYIAETNYHLEKIILPLAISFFTFQQIAYLADAYYGVAEEHKFSHYALFVTFFPQLIAGPIVHHSEMLPQFIKKRQTQISSEDIAIGLTIFSIGLFKKAVLADGIAPYATPVFSDATTGQSISFFIAWGGALAYTLQLYFDFSGYSDMAIGAARLFGIKLPLNFYSPYKSSNIIEFWRRWHMTLSRFLRDYLYIPLGGNRKGIIRRYINLFITMVLGGLWHGAGWTFIIWGALHGLYLTINHAWRNIHRHYGWLHHLTNSKLWQYFSWLITLIAVIVGWVFFRADNLSSALNILYGMLGLNGIAIPNAIFVQLGSIADILHMLGIQTFLGGGSKFILTYLWIVCLLGIALILPNTQQLLIKFKPAFDVHLPSITESIQPLAKLINKLSWSPSLIWALIGGVMLCLGIYSLSSISEFLYFQF